MQQPCFRLDALAASSAQILSPLGAKHLASGQLIASCPPHYCLTAASQYYQGPDRPIADGHASPRKTTDAPLALD